MTQLTFGDAEYVGKRKRTKREKFLAEMEQVTPWAALLARIEPAYPKAGRGRRPYPLETMLRIHLMQQWFGYSDPAMEEALYEIAPLRQFAKLTLLQALPDETTILNFRRLLERDGLAADLFNTINAHLSAHGLLLRRGTMVDATIIHAPSSTKNRENARDPEMHQTKKGNQWYFGMKAHIGVDTDSGLVHTVTTTPANVGDVTQTGALLHGDEEVVYADAGYTGAQKRPELEGIAVNWRIAERRSAVQRLADGEYGKAAGTPQGQDAGAGGAPVPGDQTAVWLHEGALSRLGQEHGADVHVVCVIEPVDGATTVVGRCRIVASSVGKMPAKAVRNERKTASGSAF